MGGTVYPVRMESPVIKETPVNQDLLVLLDHLDLKL